MTASVEYLSLPAAGEAECGDAVFVRQDGGSLLLAVVDVLGHGSQAAVVAQLAVSHMASLPPDLDATRVVESLHDALRGTRGAAATVCTIRGRRLVGCGVGNVDVRVQESPLPVVLSPGILGQNLRKLRTFTGELRENERLVCFSDGISARVSLGELRDLPPREACRMIMSRHRRSHDDATVLVADLQQGTEDASRDDSSSYR